MLYGVQTALGPSRALTSYARRIFHGSYANTYRFPQAIFLFDAALLVLCVSLVVLTLSLSLLPSAKPPLALALTASPLVSARPMPMTATLRATEDVHNVQLQWHLPPGTELLRSSPVIGADGRIFLGDLKAGVQQEVHLVVRVFQPVGDAASFGFTVSHEQNGAWVDFVGSDVREVQGSALAATVPDAFLVDTVPSSGGVIPLVVENRSDLDLPYVQLFFDPPHQDLGEYITLGMLKAQEQRFIFVPLHPERGTARITWSVRSAAREVSGGFWEAAVSDWNAPTVLGALRSTETGATIRVSGIQTAQSLLVVHPLLEQPIREIALTAPTQDIRLSGMINQPIASREWFVAPVRMVEGRRELGAATLGTNRASIPFSTSVRYTSASGDQIGAGPNPPRAGQESRYWVFWRLGPVSDALRDLQVRMSLPQGVRATGVVSASDGGDWEISNRSVVWRLPALGTESTEAAFGFEISITPSSSEIGQLLLLANTSTASALDAHTEVFQTEAPPKWSALEEDGFQRMKGVVTP